MKIFQRALITAISAVFLILIFLNTDPESFVGKTFFLIVSLIFLFYGFSFFFSLLQKIFGREEFYERDFWGKLKKITVYLSFYLWGLSFLKIFNFISIVNLVLISAILILFVAFSLKGR